MAIAPSTPTSGRRYVINDRATPRSRREGVAPSRIVLPPGNWNLILDFLTERFTTIPRSEIEARMSRGDVTDGQGSPIAPSRRYSPHLEIYYYRTIEAEARIPFDEVILFRDEHLIAVDKPHFLPVTPSGHYLQETLLIRLIRALDIDTLAPMHRIDRETAGVVLFTIEPRVRGQYQQLFAQRTVLKHYEAIAPYRPDLQMPIRRRSRLVTGEPFMRMQEDGTAKDAEHNADTQIELLEVFPGETLARYRLTPSTGKKHQLRVHMASLGIPILNDSLYPEVHSQSQLDANGYAAPLKLLARDIAFKDPITGAERCFQSRFTLSVN